MMDETLQWVIGIAITTLGGTIIGVLATWLKNQKWVKTLNIDSVIDKAAELAIHFAESAGRKMSMPSTEKMEFAKEAFEEELARQGIKLDSGAIDKRLEGMFNKLKPMVEAWKNVKKEVK